MEENSHDGVPGRGAGAGALLMDSQREIHSHCRGENLTAANGCLPGGAVHLKVKASEKGCVALAEKSKTPHRLSVAGVV